MSITTQISTVITALDRLAETTPTDPGKLAALLQGLHEVTGPCVIGSLTQLLDSLAAKLPQIPGIEMTDPEAAAAPLHLERAAATISGAGNDHLDRASSPFTPSRLTRTTNGAAR